MTETAVPIPAVRPRRNLRWILIGVLAICLGGLGSAVLYSSVSNATSVLKVNRTIYRGEVIGAADLGPVSLGTHLGVETVPAERALAGADDAQATLIRAFALQQQVDAGAGCNRPSERRVRPGRGRG